MTWRWQTHGKSWLSMRGARCARVLLAVVVVVVVVVVFATFSPPPSPSFSSCPKHTPSSSSSSSSSSSLSLSLVDAPLASELTALPTWQHSPHRPARPTACAHAHWHLPAATSWRLAARARSAAGIRKEKSAETTPSSSPSSSSSESRAPA